jgi:predicted nuclease of predicted toxin-antitoxin system
VRFLLDQNLSPKTTLFLESLGLEAYDLRKVGLTGVSDEEVYIYANENNLGIVTYNTGFRGYLKSRDDSREG